MLLPLLLNLASAPPNYQGSGNLLGMLFPLNLQPLPTTPTLLVKAVGVGFYDGIFRNIGDTFYIAPQDFADANFDYSLGGVGYPEYGWMVLDPGAQVSASYSTDGVTAATKRRSVY